MIHELKIWPMYYDDIKDGKKTFEIRKHDRDYKVGDELLLREFVPENYYKPDWPPYYTGRILHRKILYIQRGGTFGIDHDMSIFSLGKI